jgi:hypothetical protein
MTMTKCGLPVWFEEKVPVDEPLEMAACVNRKATALLKKGQFYS